MSLTFKTTSQSISAGVVRDEHSLTLLIYHWAAFGSSPSVEVTDNTTACPHLQALCYAGLSSFISPSHCVNSPKEIQRQPWHEASTSPQVQPCRYARLSLSPCHRHHPTAIFLGAQAYFSKRTCPAGVFLADCLTAWYLPCPIGLLVHLLKPSLRPLFTHAVKFNSLLSKFYGRDLKQTRHGSQYFITPCCTSYMSQLCRGVFNHVTGATVLCMGSLAEQRVLSLVTNAWQTNHLPSYSSALPHLLSAASALCKTSRIWPCVFHIPAHFFSFLLKAHTVLGFILSAILQVSQYILCIKDGLHKPTPSEARNYIHSPFLDKRCT